ncbi:poly(ethylene terephthalate) hydrolase family protein [Actinokineospora pegani]|uniref:poly(ethylene terephthalate) hydrolase family protein n=1 Tax=Actinokineospora pegani TaxID=2654637 RepID=UPI0012EA92ED|nr:dienelactone hydrolase family protein [Actinokineospora pegani]
MRLRRSLIASFAAVVVLVGVNPVGAAAPPDWSAPGPNAVAVDIRLGNTYYRPAKMDRPLPVILWGNGTGAIPGVYSGLLRHLASHGFIVAAANTPQSNSGQEMLAGLSWLRAANANPVSPYRGKVDLDHVGAVGHSQGGAGAINAAADPAVDTTVALQPGPLATPERLHGPILFLSGERDSIVDPERLVLPLYERSAGVPAWYAELAGATHFTPVPDGGGYRGVITAWFLYNLTGDQRAAAEFTGACGLCADPAYSDVRRNPRATG